MGAVVRHAPETAEADTTAREFYAEPPREIRLRLIAEEEAGIDSDVGQSDSH